MGLTRCRATPNQEEEEDRFEGERPGDFSQLFHALGQIFTINQSVCQTPEVGVVVRLECRHGSERFVIEVLGDGLEYWSSSASLIRW